MERSWRTAARVPVFFVLWVGAARTGAGQDLGGWAEPDEGWRYVYSASEGEAVDGEFDPVFSGLSLDGTWTHNNGSDAWDGSGPGDEFRPDGVTPAAPGGAGIVILEGLAEDGDDAEVLSVVDTGDPRARGFPDPSNRKTWFCHDTIVDGVDAGGSLRTGLTLIIRSRNHPDVDPAAPGWQLPDGGLDNDAGQGAAPGYALRDGGKGGHGFYDAVLDRNFSMTPHGTRGYQLPPQVGEGLPPANFLDLGDNTVFHSMWVTIEDPDANDRYDVTVYVDGAGEPAAFFDEIQLGDDTDCDGQNHLHIGFHSTPQVGGVQIDYFGYALGVQEPFPLCAGGFAAEFDAATGNVDLSWSPAGVDGYTILRNGEVLAQGIPAATTSYTDTNPVRPSSTYELQSVEGGAPLASCVVQMAAVTTVVCPELTCFADRASSRITLQWTAPGHFSATGYRILEDGSQVGTAPAGATSFSYSSEPGEHTVELVVENAIGACAANPFCEVRLLARGAVEVKGEVWDQVVMGGSTQRVITSDGAKSVWFPAVQHTSVDTAAFAVRVDSFGGGGQQGGGAGVVRGQRFKVEIQARYDNEVRIVNRSADPESFVHFNLARTGVSVAMDDDAVQENVEQVPNPGGDPAIDSASSTLVRTQTVGLVLEEGLNLIEILPVDGNGNPHDDNMQIFELRIGPFAADLVASVVEFPCPSSFGCTRGDDGRMHLSWSSGDPHAYEIERDGVLIAEIPLGDSTEYADDPGPGFFTYTLRATDDPSCADLTCSGGGGVPDSDGFIREWLVLGPLDYGCVTGGFVRCDAPGEASITEDHLRGTTTEGAAVEEIDIQPLAGLSIRFDPANGTTVRNTARTDINPDRPAVGQWFAVNSAQSLIDYNVVFGADPGNDYMAYACTYVVNTSGEAIEADLGVTSDDSVQVYINDLSVHVNNVARPVGLPGSAEFDVVSGVALEPGLNRILVKVYEGGGGTGFALRFQVLDEFGVPVPVTEDLLVQLSPEVGPPPEIFHRGDPMNTGMLNLTNGIAILNWLFLGGDDPLCADAADVDNDGQINLSDGIGVFNFLFLGGPPPRDPGPPSDPCGPDPSEPADALDCATYTHCQR